MERFGRRPIRGALLGVALGLAVAGPGRLAPAAEPASAVVVMYHRFGDGKDPSTNIRLDQFEAHLAELATGRYHVRPIPEIVAALAAGQSLPDRTVGISIDDAFLSAHREAWPRLRRAGLPFTLFVATDAIDGGGRGYMSWDQLRALARAGVTIGSQTASHPHMPDHDRGRIRAELDRASARFETELGSRPTLFAYPYGEASLAVMEEVRERGFVAAFGQHSGVLHGGANMFYLPRFTFNETYGDARRFRLAAGALPMYATEVTPRDPTLGPNPPAFGFTLGAAAGRVGAIACFSSAHGRLPVERLGARRIEVRPPTAFAAGRARINCTAPAGDGRWRWLGTQFYIPERQAPGTGPGAER
jgi:peptidoglycan/xylan/chitin deacetylase (PgdA/CDA1 family)